MLVKTENVGHLTDLSLASQQRLIERDAELATLERSFAHAGQGRGRIVLVSGGVGAGKTELLHAFTDRLKTAETVVLSAAGTAGGPRFGVLRQLRRALGRTAVPISDDATDQAVVQRFCLEVGDLAEQIPVVVVVDDAQDADEASLKGLLLLADELRSARILLLLTEGTTGRMIDPAHRVELVRQPYLQRLRLSPLTERGTQQLLAEQLDLPTARQMAAEVHAITGGNPLLVRALVEDHQNLGGSSASPVAGDGFGHALRSCLRRGTPGSVELARAAAILADAATGDRLARLLAWDERDVMQLVRDMGVDGLLDGDELRHPVLATAVLAELGMDEAAELNLAAARLLYEDGVRAADVAKHLLAAGRIPEPWAMAQVRAAADQELATDDSAAAIRLLEFAFGECSQETDRAAVRLALVRAQSRREPGATVRHIAPLCAASEAGYLDAEQMGSLLRLALWHGRVHEGTALVERLRGSSAQPGTELSTAGYWLRLCYPELAGMPARRPDVEPPPPVGQLAQSAAALADVLRGIEPGGRSRQDDSAKIAVLVLQTTSLSDGTVEALDLAVQTLMYCDQLEAAATWCKGLLAEAEARGVTWWRARFAAVGAEIARRRGNLPKAMSHAELALSLVGVTGWGVGVGGPLATYVLAAVAMGRLTDAQCQLAQPVPDVLSQTRFGLMYRFARGKHYLATDRVRAALADFLHCGQLMSAWRLDAAELVPWRLAAAECHLRLGDPEKASELAQQQLVRLGSRRGRQFGSTMRVLAGTVTPRVRLRMLKESIEALHACGDRVELAAALHDLGRTHELLGEFGKAEMVLDRARQVSAACQDGVRPLSGGVTREQAMSVLTMSELRVASLASLGYTNREISQKLHITVSTVEQHLTKVFRKLKVKRRTDLPTDLEMDAGLTV